MYINAYTHIFIYRVSICDKSFKNINLTMKNSNDNSNSLWVYLFIYLLLVNCSVLYKFWFLKIT